jgi:hypothetical protein
MKHCFLCLFLFMAISPICVAQKKMGYDFPEEATSDTARKNFVKNFNKGHILYNLSCARCHTIKENKLEIIPDFSLPQLMDYEMRLYPEHEGQMDDTRVADTEMNNIILFLRYKKKSGRTVRQKSTL